jgi:hypothetical protein
MTAPVFLESTEDARFMFFWITTKLITRINKLEKVNIPTDHIVRVLDGFIAAAVPHNIVATFRNAWISLLLDNR